MRPMVVDIQAVRSRCVSGAHNFAVVDTLVVVGNLVVVDTLVAVGNLVAED